MKNRYVTRGVNAAIDIRVQLVMWNLIDRLKEEKRVELDYLQVFELSKKGSSIIIKHSQEVPQYHNEYSIEMSDIELDSMKKIYVIDSGEYSTMLLPHEY